MIWYVLSDLVGLAKMGCFEICSDVSCLIWQVTYVIVWDKLRGLRYARISSVMFMF